MKINYVLIDYENVRPDDLSALSAEHFRVLVFVGANLTRIPFELAEAVQRLGSRAEYVKISGNGPNALDFHIAFYIGQLAAREPNALIHVISKDTGFDPLIGHLKEKKVLVKRSAALTDILAVKAASAKSPAERLELVVASLRKRPAGRPGSEKTLAGTINSLFQKQLSEVELAALIAELQARGFITVVGTKIVYSPKCDPG